MPVWNVYVAQRPVAVSLRITAPFASVDLGGYAHALYVSGWWARMLFVTLVPWWVKITT